MATTTVPAPAEARPPASAAARFWHSTIGKKIVMAASGLIMGGFLVTHMTANLLAFAGPEQINRYSHFLHETPELLWPARLVLLASLVLHVVSALQLTQLSNAARPVKYAKRDPQASTIASRTIRWGGVLLFIFIVYHILHFTTGTLHPSFMEGDPYGNVVHGFTDQKWSALFYIVMMIVLGMHLYHGVWSAFRTLGVTQPSAHPMRHKVAGIVAVVLWLGFTAVPVGVLLGFIGYDR